ncbi:hypothetical protein ORV05_04930 [Amycolatopsis cynarae]|uniref:Uncharacterized protein n=1 Tax=Amycolatopsis cynarae TaxID=2995223 RepID=A0ABY7B478_9PSEU|nr:hypothetical protein [Amycolatopsis sp. HUAS 11-8]WAL67136.1 hypothetical protein ORV05_04930 [Amycolatopsis sp. HUAS 11-8]
MRIIVPCITTMLHPQTAAWATANGAELWPLLPGRDYAYFELLREIWERDPGDTMIVEHDMVPAPGMTQEMADCPYLWCSSPYTVGTGVEITDGLGCVKFAGLLKQASPDLMRRVGEIDDDGLPARDWRRLDTRISRMLRHLGYRPHLHASATHLHDYRERP